MKFQMDIYHMIYSMVALLMVLMVLVAFIMLLNNKNEEKFTTKKEKTEAITQWFKTTPNPTYTQYKQDFPKGTNIVEYEDALRLHQTGKQYKLINYI